MERGPARAQGTLFPSAFPGLPECWNVGRLGMFTARIFPSQGDRFQLEPGDISPVGRGYRRDGWGGGRGGTAPTALLLGPGLGSHPLWEMQGGPSEGAAGLLEKQWEAKQEGTVSRASELWNVSGTCGWIRYHEGQGDVCS